MASEAAPEASFAEPQEGMDALHDLAAIQNEFVTYRALQALKWARTDRLTTPMVLDLLKFCGLVKMNSSLPYRPANGQVFYFEASTNVSYRNDGYEYKKKLRSNSVREDHVKLRINGAPMVYASYVHLVDGQVSSSSNERFHRRAYWLLQPDEHVKTGVLVHYQAEDASDAQAPDKPECKCLFCLFLKEDAQLGGVISNKPAIPVKPEGFALEDEQEVDVPDSNSSASPPLVLPHTSSSQNALAAQKVLRELEQEHVDRAQPLLSGLQQPQQQVQQVQQPQQQRGVARGYVPHGLSGRLGGPGFAAQAAAPLASTAAAAAAAAASGMGSLGGAPPLPRQSSSPSQLAPANPPSPIPASLPPNIVSVAPTPFPQPSSGPGFFPAQQSSQHAFLHGGNPISMPWGAGGPGYPSHPPIMTFPPQQMPPGMWGQPSWPGSEASGYGLPPQYPAQHWAPGPPQAAGMHMYPHNQIYPPAPTARPMLPLPEDLSDVAMDLVEKAVQIELNLEWAEAMVIAKYAKSNYLVRFANGSCERVVLYSDGRALNPNTFELFTWRLNLSDDVDVQWGEALRLGEASEPPSKRARILPVTATHFSGEVERVQPTAWVPSRHVTAPEDVDDMGEEDVVEGDDDEVRAADDEEDGEDGDGEDEDGNVREDGNDIDAEG